MRNLRQRISCTPIFQAFSEVSSPHISRPSILHLGMVTHSNCRSWQSITSSVLQVSGISAVLVRSLGLYYKVDMFHFKFMNRIPNPDLTWKSPLKQRLPKIPCIIYTFPFLVIKLAKNMRKLREYIWYVPTSLMLSNSAFCPQNVYGFHTILRIDMIFLNSINKLIYVVLCHLWGRYWNVAY
jgi:hypothetical protein